MNRFISIIFVVLLAFLGACEEPEDFSDEYTDEGLEQITATFMDGSGGFTPEEEPPFGDTVKIIFPYFYPEESDNEIDISEMRLSANLPNNVTMEPGLSVHDMNEPLDVTVTAANGETYEHTIVGEIRKSSDAEITEFELPEIPMSGFVIESEKIIGLVTGGMELGEYTPEIEVSPHATISPDPSEPQDFSEDVTYTVTAHDGTEVEYTVKEITPNKVESGIREGSGRLLWEKSAGDLEFTDHMETAIAVSGDYLVINTRDQDLRYYDRFSGDYIGTLPRGGLVNYGFQNFNLTNDESGNLLGCNLALAGNDFAVYKWDKDDLEAEPEPYIEFSNETGGQVGRKLSVSGDLDGDAVIFTTVTSSGDILRWDVVGGELQSQEPEVITYQGETWDFLADVVSEGNSADDNLFISGYPGDLAYVNSSSGEAVATYDLEGAEYVANHSLDFAEFNGADYLASIDVIYDYAGRGFLYDVTVPANLGTPVGDAAYDDLEVFETTQLGAEGNLNATGDIVLEESEDGYKMVLYLMVTNGGVAAYEFDCIDIDNLF
ncbi:MAG: DUF5018 domain-containing protein [Bacteroidota bacterium]